MAQYDLHLIQNRAGAGIAFDEEIVNVSRGGLLTASADANRNMRWLAVGSQNDVLSVDANGDLVWATPSGGHTQGTDLGTTSTTFAIDSDGFDVLVKAETADKIGLRNSTDTAYVDLQAKAITASSIALTTGTITTAPSGVNDIVNKAYADGLLGDADALTYKGVIDASTNPNYPSANAGDVYFISVAGKIGGASGIDVEVGDMLICNTDSTASGTQATVGAFWNIIQSNLTSAVQGPASATDGYFAIFDGTTGKLIKNGVGAPGTMAYETATNYVAKALFDANTILQATTDNTPVALTVPEQTLVGRITAGNITALTASQVRTLLDVPTNTEAVLDTLFDANTILTANVDNTPLATTIAEQRIVGRITGGNIGALTGAQVMNVIWSTAPTLKTSTGVAGEVAYDTNFFYVCTATNTWKRAPITTNWT